MLKYPIPKDKRVAIVKLYYHICTTPGMPMHIVSTCSENLQVLTRSKKKMSVEDVRLPWKPVYKILSKDLFLTRRQFEIRCGTVCSLRWVTIPFSALTSASQSNRVVHGLHRGKRPTFLPPRRN